jgi:hypothetical protein
LRAQDYINDAPPERPGNTRKWFYAPTRDEEEWPGGPFDTEEEAIVEGRSEYSEDPPYGEEMETFGVMEAEEVLPDATLCDALGLEDVLERMEDYVIDQCANTSNDSIFSVNKDYTEKQAEEALHAVLGAWARKYLHCYWHNGIDTKEVPVKPEEEE